MSPTTTLKRGAGAGRGEQDGNARDRMALIEAMSDPATYGGDAPVAVHQTHASWVFVVGGRAYKIKKPVALGFLDYRTLALRHGACEEEVRVNRELAPDIYLGVCAIVRVGDRFELTREQDPAAVEYAVEMRSFRDCETLAGLISRGALEPRHIIAVASRLAAFHLHAPEVEGGDPAAVLRVWERNLEELAAAAREQEEREGQGWEWSTAAALEFGGAFIVVHASEIEERRRAGLVRDGHGDLRCEHVLPGSRVGIVDRIEFDASLRRLDVAADLAFLTMDLEGRGERWAAEELISVYRRVGLDPGGEALRSFHGAHWAFVRAKVALIAANGREDERSEAHLAEARAMWSLGERLCWRARGGVAVLICGPPASGKSTLAAELARGAGLRVLGSDEIRKALAGVRASERAGAEHYRESFSRATYERLALEADYALERDSSVIIDATCRSRVQRAPLLEKLSSSGVPCLVVRCVAPLPLALSRAESRMREGAGVSDATPEIVAAQFDSFEEIDELPRAVALECDTERPLREQVTEVCRALDQVMG